MALTIAGMTHLAPRLRPSPPDRRLGQRLDREWSQLRSRPAALRHAAGWAIVEGPLHDLDQVLVAVGYEVAWTPANEAAMRRLVVQAADDELAARVVIQRVLPGLLAVVRRRSGRPDEVLDELIGAAWIAVRTFNPARRPRCIAAALIADADYRAFRLVWRRASSSERPTDVPRRTARRHRDRVAASAPGVAVRAGDGGRCAAADLDLMRRIVDETPTEELARSAERDGAHGAQPARSDHRPAAGGCARCVKFGRRFSRNDADALPDRRASSRRRPSPRSRTRRPAPGRGRSGRRTPRLPIALDIALPRVARPSARRRRRRARRRARPG